MADPAQAALPSGGREIDVVRTETAELWKLSWPVVLSRLGIMVMGLSDAIVVGRFSATQLGYHALAWAPTSVVVTMAVGLLTGVQVMTARRIGEGRREATGAVLRRGIAYSFWIGLISMAVTLAAGPSFLHVIGLEKDLADGASKAMLVFALSLPGYAFSVAASSLASSSPSRIAGRSPAGRAASCFQARAASGFPCPSVPTCWIVFKSTASSAAETPEIIPSTSSTLPVARSPSRRIMSPSQQDVG